MKSNFVVVYELLDEMFDFGYPQITNEDMLQVRLSSHLVAIPPQHKGTHTAHMAHTVTHAAACKTKLPRPHTHARTHTLLPRRPSWAVPASLQFQIAAC